MYSLNTTFNVQPGEAKSFTFEGPPEADDNFACYLTWGRPDPKKDLKLEVTFPTGAVHVSDNDAATIQKNASEVVWGYAPLPVGTWTVKVTNNGSARVRATITAGFGN